MPDPTPPRPGTSPRASWFLICALLLPAVLVPLLVPLYDRTEPTLFDFPFYYWFQLALIPAAVVLTVIAYYLAKAADRRRREAQGRTAQGGQPR